MDSRHQRLDTPDGRLGFPFVGSRTDRKIRCHDADAPCFGDARDHLAALGHADDFKIMAVADGFFSQDRNRIARRNQSLDVAVREVVGHLVHETDDILTGPVAIGRIERIAQKMKCSWGMSSCRRRRTVSPPTPESMTPIGCCLFMMFPPRQLHKKGLKGRDAAIQALLTDGWQGNCFHITKE